jgi:hypothetical protein
MIVIGMDPSNKNWAYSVVVNGNTFDYGFVENTITDIKTTKVLCEQVNNFIKDMKNITDISYPDVIVIERFMASGRLTGIASECINMMIGIILCYYQNVNMITASSWKNMKSLSSIRRPRNTMTIHEWDAIRIAYYHLIKNKIYTKDSCLSLLTDFYNPLHKKKGN